MTCCTGSVDGPSRSPPSSATSGRPAGPWHPPSTSDRWRRQLDRYGPEILRPRERRVPRMATQTRPLVEQRVVALALGHPGFGPARIAAELARPTWGGISLSTNGVWRAAGSPRPQHPRPTLWPGGRRRGTSGPERPPPPPGGHLDVDHPGQLVQLDCLCIGRLSGTKGTVWQYTAIDVASASTWTTLQVTRRNPRPTGPASSPARSPPTWPSVAGSWSGS